MYNVMYGHRALHPCECGGKNSKCKKCENGTVNPRTQVWTVPESCDRRRKLWYPSATKKRTRNDTWRATNGNEFERYSETVVTHGSGNTVCSEYF